MMLQYANFVIILMDQMRIMNVPLVLTPTVDNANIEMTDANFVELVMILPASMIVHVQNVILITAMIALEMQTIALNVLLVTETMMVIAKNAKKKDVKLASILISGALTV